LPRRARVASYERLVHQQSGTVHGPSPFTPSPLLAERDYLQVLQDPVEKVEDLKQGSCEQSSILFEYEVEFLVNVVEGQRPDFHRATPAGALRMYSARSSRWTRMRRTPNLRVLNRPDFLSA